MDEYRLLPEVDFCAFDVETTGNASRIRMVELGATRFRMEGECEFFSTLVDPGVHISSFVTCIHGITDEMVAGAPGAREVLDSFFTFASGSVLLAHNAPFDTAVVSVELTRHAMPVPDFPILDTLSLARRFIPGPPNYKLSTLTDWLGLFTQCAHRGLPDAVAAREIFRIAVGSIENWRSLTLCDLRGLCGAGAFGRYRAEDIELPPGLEAIREAMGEGRAVRVIYSGGSRGLAPRLITPQGLYERRGFIYLEAYCHESCVVKHYRVDRIIEVHS
jgi:DNA polymerase-3 subunit epsilon